MIITSLNGSVFSEAFLVLGEGSPLLSSDSYLKASEPSASGEEGVDYYVDYYVVGDSDHIFSQ